MEHLKDSYEWLKETNKIESQIRGVSDNLRLINIKNNLLLNRKRMTSSKKKCSQSLKELVESSAAAYLGEDSDQ